MSCRKEGAGRNAGATPVCGAHPPLVGEWPFLCLAPLINPGTRSRKLPTQITTGPTAVVRGREKDRRSASSCKQLGNNETGDADLLSAGRSPTLWPGHRPRSFLLLIHRRCSVTRPQVRLLRTAARTALERYDWRDLEREQQSCSISSGTQARRVLPPPKPPTPL